MNQQFHEEYCKADREFSTYLSTFDLTQKERKEIVQDVHAMILESDLRNIPLAECFPEGMEAFADELILQVKGNSSKEYILKVLSLSILFFLLYCLMKVAEPFFRDIRIPDQIELDVPLILSLLLLLFYTYAIQFIKHRHILRKGRDHIWKWGIIAVFAFASITVLIMIRNWIGSFVLHVAPVPVISIACALLLVCMIMKQKRKWIKKRQTMQK